MQPFVESILQHITQLLSISMRNIIQISLRKFASITKSIIL